MTEYWRWAGVKLRKQINLPFLKKVRKTKPVSFVYDPNVVVVSQVYSQGLDMALLALKSFMLKLGRGRIEIIDDGSLTEHDKFVLNKHLDHLSIVHIKDIPLGKCPEGGTWERLVHILELSKSAYVIQVDTDTLTVGPIPEIYQNILSNKAFTIGGPDWPAPAPVEYVSHVASTSNLEHVQIKSEKKLDEVSSIPLMQYCRGCSALTGFPKSVVKFEQLEAFSCEMEVKIGSKTWREWGTEQVSSNVMVSLCPGVSVLPWPKYLNHGFPFLPAGAKSYRDYLGVSSVLHFIGTHRFKNGVYRKLAALVIKEIDFQQTSVK